MGSKPVTQRQILHDSSYMRYLKEMERGGDDRNRQNGGWQVLARRRDELFGGCSFSNAGGVVVLGTCCTTMCMCLTIHAVHRIRSEGCI